VSKPRLLERVWTLSHRCQLWQLIVSGLEGVHAGDILSKSLNKDLRQAGYAVRDAKHGRSFATPNGERALRGGQMADGLPMPKACWATITEDAS
jgi:hypothetical protein